MKDLTENSKLFESVINKSNCQSDFVPSAEKNCVTCQKTENSELSDSERTRCEVWSRVMGYYRPTDSYNVGKKSEYDERVCFKEKTQETQSETQLNIKHENQISNRTINCAA